jgi:hypothetical protein
LAGTALAALPVIYFNNPNTTHVPLCPLHALTGLNCPLCGGTRAVYALMHGDVATAIRDNAPFVLGLPLIAFVLLRWTGNAVSCQQRRMLPRTVWLVLLALIVVFGVVRNLPFGGWLSPPT